MSKLGMGNGASQGSTGTFFSTPTGVAADNTNFPSTESQAKNRQRKSMTVNNLAIFVPTNGSGTSTFKSRKNGANGNREIPPKVTIRQEYIRCGNPECQNSHVHI